jgi:putative hemolysin
MEILVILLLILLNGLFSMSELAVVSSRRYSLEKKAKEGNQNAKKALRLANDPSHFLSTNQIGITLIGITLGAFSGETLVKPIESILSYSTFLQPAAKELAFALTVVTITGFTLVFGELLPKRLGLTYPESIAMRVAAPLLWLSRIAYPIVWFLSTTNKMLLKLFRIKEDRKTAATEEELRYMIHQSASSGEIDFVKQDLVERVFNFGDASLSSLMTARDKIIYFDENINVLQARQKVRNNRHSAYPLVKKNDLDQTIGLILIKDLFALGEEEKLISIARRPLFLDSQMPAHQVLDIFRESKTHYSLVVDEKKRTLGIITMDDVMESLVGKIVEFDLEDYSLTQRTENTWLVDARYPSIDFLRYFDLTHLCQQQLGFNTTGGLFTDLLGKNPDLGDILELGDYQLEAIDKDRNILDKIMVTKIRPSKPDLQVY